jgi:tRNA threonylcarbamoyladenosine biosynthesis protein TsaB
MNLLAFDTSTETMSIALARGQGLWQHAGTGGAQASASLIPAINGLMEEAQLAFSELDAIAFGNGPGSFTGLRTACSVAQGLAFGAGVPVLPVDTLLAVAEEARHQHGVQRVVAALDARMDEIYTAAYMFDGGRWSRQEDFRLLRPEDLAIAPGFTLAGNAMAAYGDRLPPPGPGLSHLPALPAATAMLRLAPALLAAGLGVRADEALPRYIRDKVAKTTDERAAEKAAASAMPSH